MVKTSKKKVQENFTVNSKKWTPTLMEAGWTVLPSVIIDKQTELGLDPVDINIILHLAKYWWSEEKLPYPSKSTMAKKMGRSPSTIQKHIAKLEKANLIKRIERYHRSHKGQLSNQHSLDGLIEAATPYAEEAIKLKKKQQKERREA